MHMLARPHQSIQTALGRQYRADEHGVIANVESDDVGELRRVGCRDMPPPAVVRPLAAPPAPAAAPAAPAPAAVAPAAPAPAAAAPAAKPETAL